MDVSLHKEVSAARVQNAALVGELQRHQAHYRRVIEE